MYAYLGRDNVDIFDSLHEATAYGYSHDALFNLIVFAKGVPIKDSLYRMFGMATCMISYEQKVAVLILTGERSSADDHWHAVVAAFAIFLDRVDFGDVELRLASSVSIGHPIEPAKLLLPPELPF